MKKPDCGWEKYEYAHMLAAAYKLCREAYGKKGTESMLESLKEEDGRFIGSSTVFDLAASDTKTWDKEDLDELYGEIDLHLGEWEKLLACTLNAYIENE
jgi:hypothetical protein